MSCYHTVQQGEHLSSIAKDYGFSDYRTIWNRPENAQLKAKRQNPNVLYPRDVVFIPDKGPRIESRSTDARHKFKVRGTKLRLRLVLEDQYEKPIANAPCLLVIEGEFRQVTTDGSGKIDEEIPQDAHEAMLVIKDAQTPFDFVQIPIKIGHLDPVEEVEGQRGRLINLGYLASDTAEEATDQLRSAIEEFQCDQGLTVDGICGPQTQAKLKQVHGC